MKPFRLGRSVLVLAGALVACATQSESQTGVTNQQPASACLRGGVPCTKSEDCCSHRCAIAVCQAPLVTPETIKSLSPDDLPTEPASGLGTPGGQESGPK